jgi:hypothetical protein
MKFLPTLDVWNSGIHSAIINGQLKLQVGQFIQCGDGIKSRFISVNNGVINAAHGGTNKEVNFKLNQRASIRRLAILRSAKK